MLLSHFLTLSGFLLSKCPQGTLPSLSNPNLCFYFGTQLLPYMNAEEQCINHDGHLTTTHGIEEDIYLSQKAGLYFNDSTTSDFWFGANKMSGNWEWIDGTIFNFTHWDNSEPQNHSDNICGALSLAGGKWSAQDCYKVKPYICTFTFEGPSIDDEISLNSTFPNGSTTVKVNNLGQGLSVNAPLEVDITMLQEIGVNVDNSSFVAENGRMSFFYIRLPHYQSNETNKRVDNENNIGIRFGNSSIINVIPLSLTHEYDSGLSVIETMSDSSIYQLKIRMAENMCSGSTSDACTVINWTPYLISNSNEGSPGNFNNLLHVACGSQCDVASNSQCATSSCSTCDGKTVAGEDTPVTRRYKMEKNSGNFTFTYNTYNIKDRIIVTYGTQTLHDSTCVGTEGDKTVQLSFSGTSQAEVRVDVEPNCDGTTGTAWDFTVSCLSPCSLSNGMVHLMSEQDEIKDSGNVFITEDAQMPLLTAYYCGNQSSQNTVDWTFKVEHDYTICLKECSSSAKCCQSEKKYCNTPTYPGTDQVWNITNLFTTVIGGKATLTWKDSQKNSGTIKFMILGTQPANSKIINYIDQQTSLWYAKYIASHESHFVQFGGKQPPGYPMYALDFGYGIFQITNPAPTCDDLWNWKANVNDGIEILNKKQIYANKWMIDQTSQANSDTGKHIPVPCHVDGNCVFGENQTPMADAVAIKAFNGASLGNYLTWKNANKCWQFHDVNSNGIDYVNKICQLVPPTSYTCPSTTNSSYMC